MSNFWGKEQSKVPVAPYFFVLNSEVGFEQGRCECVSTKQLTRPERGFSPGGNPTLSAKLKQEFVKAPVFIYEKI